MIIIENILDYTDNRHLSDKTAAFYNYFLIIFSDMKWRTVNVRTYHLLDFYLNVCVVHYTNFWNHPLPLPLLLAQIPEKVLGPQTEGLKVGMMVRTLDPDSPLLSKSFQRGLFWFYFFHFFPENYWRVDESRRDLGVSTLFVLDSKFCLW